MSDKPLVDDLDSTGADAATRPPSLWPASTRPAGLGSTNPAPAAKRPGTAADVAAAAALDICASALALRALLAVQLVLAIVVLVGSGPVNGWLARQAVATFVGLAASLLWLVVCCAARRPLARQPRAVRAAMLCAWGALCALIAWWPVVWADLAAAGPLTALGVALAGAALAAALLVWLDQRARLGQPGEARARLAELQSRIRPHFLFNALNTALALVRVDPLRAETVLEDLAQLFRVALADAGASVSLDEELELAQRYLAIEQLRYGSRLTVSWDIDSRVGVARVPPLVLQPLVENAVRHGVEPSLQGAQLWVQASVRRGQAVILVSNTVADVPSTPGHGMALRNVRERLHLLHDVAGQCEVWREGGLFRARVTVPL